MTELERKIKAKIPGADTGIEVKKSLCAICSPGNHCGLDVYVKDGKILKVECTPEHPYNQGHICTKGAMNRAYIYRKDRIRTPLRRVGKRGEGKFEPITWEEAYAEIAEKLNRVKDDYGANSVAFTTGYCKWYRPYYHRFVYAFGSVNYSTDDCTCYRAMVLANECTMCRAQGPDIAHTNTLMAWAWGGFYSDHLSMGEVEELKARGGKIVVIDSRITRASQRFADVFLHIRPGTDGALALGMAKIILDNGWADMDFIRRYTYGFEEYAAYVKQFDLERVARITGLNLADIMEATRLFATNGPACCNFSASTLTQQYNGFQTHRAILCLLGLTGNIDRPGGNIPSSNTYLCRPAGFKSRESQYYMEKAPDLTQMFLYDKFPIWYEYCHETQAITLADVILSGEPYPIKALYGVGMNFKMYPQTDKLVKALDQIDFFVNTDLFMTYTSKFADIVLPCCSSLERGEFKVYPGGYGVYTKPVIQPLYESKSDTDILCELARYMELDDPLLLEGYEASVDYIMQGCGLTVEQFKQSDLPVKMPNAAPTPVGTTLRNGFTTPSGKFEFYSNVVARYEKSHGLSPLPVYIPSFADDPSPEFAREYPFFLSAGCRIPNTLHSRLHEVPWSRAIRPEPMVEIHPDDARRLDIHDGDLVEVYSPSGSVTVKAMLTHRIHTGTVEVAHGYTEANISQVVSDQHQNPYTGFPGYKASRCNIRKV